MADERKQIGLPPPVPGFWHLGWLLFMQPLVLHRLYVTWGFEGDPSLMGLWRRMREGDPVVRELVARLGGWIFLSLPVGALTTAGSLSLLDLPVDWRVVAFGVLVCVAYGVAGGIFYGLGAGVALSFVGGIAGGLGSNFTHGFLQGSTVVVAAGIAAAVASGLALGVGLGVGKGVRRGDAFGLGSGLGAGVVSGVLMGGSVGARGGMSLGLAVGIAVGVAFFLGLFRLPLYPLELALTAALRLATRLRPAALPRLSSYLPYHHHDLIYLPLPFLEGLLVWLGEEHPAKGRRALADAAASLGQKGPARRALGELQARSLERAARERQYASAAVLSLPFLPGREGLSSSGDPRSDLELASAQTGWISINSIAAAAQDLVAARSTGSHHQRRQAVTRARKELERTLDLLASTRLRNGRRFLLVVQAWLDRVTDEEAELAALERERPQVPLVFVAGVPLTSADESLFVGRRNLARLLDQDLAAERPVPLVLVGQRRMGKSTLLNFLPRLLGTGTRVVRLDFQGISGHPLRGEPHRWLAADVAATLAREGIETQPLEAAPWGATLDWLTALEEPLTTANRRLLIALDEVEGLERGIREGWGDPAFLDFLRAAGDRLRRIRFLLVTAHPFSRLGPHWSDRLISAQTRRIEPLAEEEARTLLTRPVAGFPDIYPPGGVERLLGETACHPYLLQLTAYDLTRRLNEAGCLKATDDDLTAALDQALEENNLFQNLWDDLAVAEQRLMAALARGERLLEAAGESSETLNKARRDLAREQLIRQGAEGWQVAVPLFARWIREIGAIG
jgi:uncharacterized protein